MDEQLDCGLLTQRTLNALHYAGIYTIKDVLQYTEIQLLKTDGIGRRAINEVKEILASKGQIGRAHV